MSSIKIASHTILRLNAKRDAWCELQITITADQAFKPDPETAQAISVARDAWIEGSPEKLEHAQRILFEVGHPLTISTSGSSGQAVTPARARAMAIESWISYFEDATEEIYNMARRFNRQFRTPSGAARFVVETDGEYHGLDIHSEIGTGRASRVLLTQACGQIRDEIAEWFPEFAVGAPRGMCAGAPDQVAAMEGFTPRPYPEDFHTQACAHLESLGLLYSKHEGEIFVTGRGMRPACSFWSDAEGSTRGYKYGEGWVHAPIATSVLVAIRDACERVEHAPQVAA